MFTAKVTLLERSEFPLCALKTRLPVVQEMKWLEMPLQPGRALWAVSIHVSLLTMYPFLCCLAFHFLHLKIWPWLQKRDVDKVAATCLSYPQFLLELGLRLWGPTVWVFYNLIMFSYCHERRDCGVNALCQKWQNFKSWFHPLPRHFSVSSATVFSFHLSGTLESLVAKCFVIVRWPTHRAQYHALNLGGTR